MSVLRYGVLKSSIDPSENKCGRNGICFALTLSQYKKERWSSSKQHKLGPLHHELVSPRATPLQDYFGNCGRWHFAPHVEPQNPTESQFHSHDLFSIQLFSSENIQHPEVWRLRTICNPQRNNVRIAMPPKLTQTPRARSARKFFEALGENLGQQKMGFLG